MSKTAKVRVRKRGKSWSYIFEAGRNAKGGRQAVERGGFATEKDAYEAGTAAFADWTHGNIGITSNRISVPDYMQSWLANVAACNVRPSSLAHYKEISKLWIEPYFHDAVQDVTPAMADAWMRKLLKAGYSKKTMQLARSLFRQALDYAVHPAGLIQSNPVLYAKVPRMAPTNVVKRSVISPEQFRDLLEEHPEGTPGHIPLMLLYHTGMRIGEVLGLTWQNIDLKKNTIRITQQLLNCNILSVPKTKTSIRTIPIDKRLVEALARWHRMQSAYELASGESYSYIYPGESGKISQQSKGIRLNRQRLDMVCTKPDGRIVERHWLAMKLSSHGLNAHSFRHTHATMLIEGGATPKGVAGRLGHSTTAITQDLYTHNTEQMQRDTVDIFAHTIR